MSLERDVLFAYVDGSDLDDAAPLLRERLTALVSSASWACRVWLVDQRHGDEPLQPGDLPSWDLGVNLDARLVEADAYRQDLVRLYRGLKVLAAETGRDFVLGVNGEDLVYTSSGLTDAELLRLFGLPQE